ncbi:MAG: BamA/TamA family outer membrane protein, partial [Bacteroidota bacterium]
KVIFLFKIVTILVLLVCSYYVGAQSDSTQRPPRNWDIIPMISSSPEVGLLLGAKPVFSFKTNSSDSLLRLSFLSTELFGTLERQFGVSGKGAFFFFQNNYEIEAALNAMLNQWRYYGIGNEIDLEQFDTYRFRALSTDVVLLRKIVADVYFGLGHRYQQHLPNPEDNEMLVTDCPVGFNGFTASGVVAVLRWDSRDNILNAYQGSYLNLRAEQHRTDIGSSYPFEVFAADFRHYVSLSDKPYHVLAFQALHQATFGQVPFAELSMLGGSMINRGYFTGGYRDRHIMSVQAEYREMFSKNFGFVAFASAGNVMADYHELQPEETKVAAGIGLRFAVLPQNRINLRLDFAWGQGSQGFYFGISEAF